MLRIVSLQLIATVVVGLIAALLGGWSAMFSAVLGGLCCVVPNSIMAVRLFAATHKPGGASLHLGICKDHIDGSATVRYRQAVPRSELAGATRRVLRGAEKLHHLII